MLCLTPASLLMKKSLCPMEAREIVARVICLSAQVMCVSYLQAAPWEEFPVFDLAGERVKGGAKV